MGGLSPSPRRVAVMKVPARSRPAKGWPCLMKTDEAEIKCLPTLRDSFITVSPPRATEHLGLELLEWAPRPPSLPFSSQIASVFTSMPGCGFSFRKVLFSGTLNKSWGFREPWPPRGPPCVRLPSEAVSLHPEGGPCPHLPAHLPRCDNETFRLCLKLIN